MDYVTRIHLKRDDNIRKELIDFCLNNSEQYVAIGWSWLSEDIKLDDFWNIIIVLKNIMVKQIQQ